MHVRANDSHLWIRTFLCAALLLGAACKKKQTLVSPDDNTAFALSSTSPATPGAKTSEITPRVAVPQVAEALTDAFANAAKAIRPSVVRIDVELGGARPALAGGGREPGPMPDFLRRFFDQGGGGLPPPGPQRGMGSGVIIDNAGHVLTNAHVIARAQKVTIVLVDGRRFPAKVLGKDPLTDIGVVQFTNNPGALTIARVGDSDQLRVGQWVLAVGSPLGMDQSVTAGIVSGLGNHTSRMRVSERARGYIQTDASINPGNSGGPLVNLAGEVVGINTLINVGPGGAYGFAIPIAQAAQVGQTLIKEGRVRYPYVGVNIGDLAELSDGDRQQLGGKLPARGAVVTGIVPGSPAQAAGLAPGDLITRIGDKKIESAADVVALVGTHKIGAKVSVEVVRDGKARTVEMTLAELPGEGGPEQGKVGVVLQSMDDGLARSLGLDPGTRGAAVADVVPDSPAARAGLRPSDVIVEVDRKPVVSAEQAAAALQAGKKTILVRVVGPGGARFVTITRD